MLYSHIHIKLICIICAVFTPVLCAALLRVFRDRLPKDHGRENAVDGSLSAGKIRGAGILFVITFIVSALIFVPVKAEFAIYYALIFLEMLSGYLDDKAKISWGEYKKGLIDLVLSAGYAATFTYFNPELTCVTFFKHSLKIPAVVFGILGTVLVWMLINAVNCSDGIDGFSTTLSSISMLSAAAVIYLKGYDKSTVLLTAVMVLALLPYLWVNCQPSTMLMGDAGSRAIGMFLALLIMKTGNILLIVPLCLVVCLDGLLGIAKVSIIRFLHVKGFMKNIRTPLHDHCRKNKNWSNTQVIYRFCMLQAVVSAVTVLYFK